MRVKLMNFIKYVIMYFNWEDNIVTKMQAEELWTQILKLALIYKTKCCQSRKLYQQSSQGLDQNTEQTHTESNAPFQNQNDSKKKNK